MTVALFAIIGAAINAGAWYWICFGVYVFAWAIDLILTIVKKWCD